MGYLHGFEPIWGAMLISILAALGIGAIKRKGGMRSDVVIGLFWSLGMGMGILFIAMTPGYPSDLNSYLFGSILSVTRGDLIFMAVFTFIIVFIIVLLFNYWKVYLFDDEFASILGIKTGFLEYLLFVLIAISVAVFIRVVGIILVLALFTAPTAIAGLFVRSLKLRMLLSIIIGALFCFVGLWFSYTLNVASGAAIVLLSAVSYLCAYLLFSMKKQRVRTGK